MILVIQKIILEKISRKKNRSFSELTALYWLWKNTKAEYKGLAHYQRHFSKKKSVSIFSTGKFEDVLDEKTLNLVLEKYDVVIPQLRHYYIETIEQHYNHTHYEQDLIVTEEILRDFFPDYLDSYQDVLHRKAAHMFNMFIMRSDYFNEYCNWLFLILFELEKRLDISNYSTFHAIVYGRVSEILLDVWLSKNGIKYAEIPVMFMEKQNWIKKGTKFITSKLMEKKY